MFNQLLKIIRKPAANNLASILADPHRYIVQIEKTQQNYQAKGLLYHAEYEGVKFAQLYFQRKKFARVLADAFSHNQYQFNSAQYIERKIKNKIRVIYRLAIPDAILHAVVAALLIDCGQAKLAPTIYSYRKGYSVYSAVEDFQVFLKRYKQTAVLQERGLFVLKTDIASYAEAISMHTNSALWPILFTILQEQFIDFSEQHPFWQQLQQMFRPVICSPEGLLYQKCVGVPFGSPLANIAYNIYVQQLDKQLSRVEGGFYARYCDDMLFAHPDYNVVATVRETIEQILNGLQLKVKAEKELLFYFNGAGRSPATIQLAGKTHFDWVGCKIGFTGTIGLPKEKTQLFMQVIRRRILTTLALTKDSELTDKARAICLALNKAYTTSTSLTARAMRRLLLIVTDRKQLQQIDFRVALLIAEMVTGNKGVRAFRQLSYQQLRSNFGLLSLQQLRNKARS